MRRHGCKKFDSYRWMSQVDVVIYHNKLENRFEAEVDGRNFIDSDIQKLRADIEKFLSNVDRTEWKLFLLVGRHLGYDYDLIYKAKDGAIRNARFPGGETEAIKNKMMPELGVIRKYTKVDESAIPFTWEYLEAARLLRQRFAYLSACLEAVSESRDQQKILDAFLADKIAVPTRSLVTTDEIGGDDADLMNLLNELFEDVDNEFEDDD